jgi:hypothetical protein
MIDPKDISVGNWVIKMTGTDTHNRSYFEYKAITANEYFFTFANVCYPIEITPAILGSCGFKHQFGDWYKNMPAEGIEGGVPFLRYKHKEDAWYLREMRLPVQPRYLHQLQNIVYALLGEELPVSLGAFKNSNSVGPIDFFVNPMRKKGVTRELL